MSKCIRCKSSCEGSIFCQSCKSDLLPFFEATKDWQLAYEMESANQYMARYQRDPDYEEFSF